MDTAIRNALIARLERREPLAPGDRGHIATLLGDSRELEGGAVLGALGAPGHVPVILSGAVCRVRTLEGIGRQVTGYLLPGDIGDLGGRDTDAGEPQLIAGHSTRAALIPVAALARMARERADLHALFVSAALEDLAVAREALVSLGRRDAPGRVAHTLCEFHVRLCRAGLADETRFRLPFTQRILADLLGLSVVHVNRTFRLLQREGLMRLERSVVHVLDAKGLRARGLFDPFYLGEG